jgi:hypothetical protein
LIKIVDQANERPQQDRADAGHDADAQGHKAEDEQADPPFFPIGGGWRGRKGAVGGR